jgi:sterol desaturase/sphingolipid hydroxylase (fatty acid hydroxylase superfamily)
MKKLILSLSLILANIPSAQALSIPSLSLEDKTHAGLALASTGALVFGIYSFYQSYKEYQSIKNDRIHKEKANKILIDDIISIIGISAPITMLAGTLTLWSFGALVTGDEYMTNVGKYGTITCAIIMSFFSFQHLYII